MRPIQGFNEAQANNGAVERIEAGGYICQISGARVEMSTNGNEMLVIAFDICDGKYKDYFKNDFEARKRKASGGYDVKWRGVYRQRTTDNDGAASGFFKGLIEAIEGSNLGYRWNWDEGSLIGKRVGFIFRDEEFQRDDGSIGVSAKPTWPRTVDEIKKGIIIPDVKKLKITKSTDYSNFYANTGPIAPKPEDNDDLPF